MAIARNFSKAGGAVLMGMGALSAGFGLAAGAAMPVLGGVVELAAGRYLWSAPDKGL